MQSEIIKFNKILVANRGEIAIRILRAISELNIKTVAIYTYEDRYSLHRYKADEAYMVGNEEEPLSPYLDIEAVISVAKRKNVDAIHPGYGFLSENAEFAQRSIEAGLNFVGPSPEAIRIMGSKTLARERVQERGVQCTPGCASGLSDQELATRAAEIGFPVLIKAVAGGGGRGMKVATTAEELKNLLPRARAEAEKFFSNPDVYLEKYIEQPRHVEVQVFGDKHGNIVHMGTRECSVQRRHQKLIEEAPAPFLSDDLRSRIHEAAVNAARSVDYYNAGTVEFLVSNNDYYFLEMNTRIQVEHPVSEEVTGIDLLALQLKVAMGEAFDFKQEDIIFSGHSIEYRIY
ncbi:MAG: ATP-grasp domain-containing protein, partial [Lewinella sp.]|nr:ATP-grasp domain-containing protein [Lewinella sp.]